MVSFPQGLAQALSTPKYPTCPVGMLEKERAGPRCMATEARERRAGRGQGGRWQLTPGFC